MALQIKRGLASAWTSQNPVLLAGQLGVETDTRKLKVGNGSSAWNSLSYINVRTEDLDAALAPGRVQGELTKSYGLVAGVIRNYDQAGDGSGSSGYELIDDGFHPPIGITEVDSLSDTGLIEITYDNLLTVGADRTVSLLVGMDETLAKAGFIGGASVEPGVARIQIFQVGRASDYVYYDTGDAAYKLWKTVNGTAGEASPFAVESATSNHLSLTHDQVKKVDRFDHGLLRIGGPGENYMPVLSTSHQVNDTQRIVIDFYDDGQLVEGRPARVTTPDVKCKAIVSRGQIRNYVPPNQVNQTTYPNGNIWILGIMQMEA